MAKGLRLIVGAIIVLFPIALGWSFRSPWIIPIFGAIYVPLYFLGKAGAWTLFAHAAARRQMLKAVPIIFVLQSILVGVLYLVGVGLAALTNDRQMTWNVTGSDIGLITAFILLMVPMTGVIAFAERAKPETLVTEKSDATKAPDNASQAVWDEDGDFGTIAREITPDTFFNGWHFSRRNSTGMALTDIVDHKGDKPKREPKQASEAMVAETEKRLGVKLPETL
ncbi:MAG: hypothetical protein AAFR13_06965, partial [Pseudomonadota bacterium]